MKISSIIGYLMSALLGAGLLWTSLQLKPAQQSKWQLVFANSETGETLEGSKANLIESVRAGKQIRVYFRGRRVEHLSDSGFVTVFGGEVFAQIHSIQTQAPSLEPAKVHFRAPGIRWQAIVSTSGEFTAFADGKEPNIRTQAVKWYIQN